MWKRIKIVAKNWTKGVKNIVKYYKKGGKVLQKMRKRWKNVGGKKRQTSLKKEEVKFEIQLCKYTQTRCKEHRGRPLEKVHTHTCSQNYADKILAIGRPGYDRELSSFKMYSSNLKIVLICVLFFSVII